MDSIGTIKDDGWVYFEWQVIKVYSHHHSPTRINLESLKRCVQEGGLLRTANLVIYAFSVRFLRQITRLNRLDVHTTF